MHVVVNHLRFRDPEGAATLVATAPKALEQVAAAGGYGGRLLQVDETHLILLLEFASAEDANRIAGEVGGPWMREHVVPLLASPTERSVGEVVASA